MTRDEYLTNTCHEFVKRMGRCCGAAPSTGLPNDAFNFGCFRRIIRLILNRRNCDTNADNNGVIQGGSDGAETQSQVWLCLRAILETHSHWLNETSDESTHTTSTPPLESVAFVDCVIEAGRRHSVTHGALTPQDVFEINGKFFNEKVNFNGCGDKENNDADHDENCDNDADLDDKDGATNDGGDSTNPSPALPRCALVIQEGGIDEQLDELCHIDFVACLFDHGADGFVAKPFRYGKK